MVWQSGEMTSAVVSECVRNESGEFIHHSLKYMDVFVETQQI